MAWEAMGATSWALIGYWWRDPQRVRAADTAFLTTRTADLGLYLAAGAALAGGAASLRLDALATSRDPWLQVVAAGVVAAALGKSAQLPFSFWLSGPCGVRARCRRCCTRPRWWPPVRICCCGSDRCCPPPAGDHRWSPGWVR